MSREKVFQTTTNNRDQTLRLAYADRQQPCTEIIYHIMAIHWTFAASPSQNTHFFPLSVNTSQFAIFDYYYRISVCFCNIHRLQHYAAAQHHYSENSKMTNLSNRIIVSAHESSTTTTWIVTAQCAHTACSIQSTYTMCTHCMQYTEHTHNAHTLHVVYRAHTQEMQSQLMKQQMLASSW